jgi:hypothetical protein
LREQLEARAADLLARFGPSWGEGLPEKTTWRRGFPEVFEVRPVEYLQHTEALQQLAPVQVIRLYEFDYEEGEGDDEGEPADVPDFVRLADCPLLERWVDLEIRNGFSGIDEHLQCFETLMASPHLVSLRRLAVPTNDFGPSVCLVADARFARLTHLDLNSTDSFQGGPDDAGLATIATSPHMARLEYFDFGLCDVSDDGLCALAASPHIANLKTLKASGSYFTARGIRALGASPHLNRLTHLDLAGALVRREDLGPDSDAIVALLDSPLLSRLHGLALNDYGLRDADILHLASRSDLSALRFLGIGGPSLSPEAIRTLLESPALARLSHLDLTLMPMTGELVSVLESARQLTQLTVYSPEHQPIAEDILHALRGRFHLTVLTEY